MVTKEPTALSLQDQYEVSVYVTENGHTFLGLLTCDLKSIKLRISGENVGKRQYDVIVSDIAELRCQTRLSNTYHLFNLRYEEGGWTEIPTSGTRVRSFNIVYTVEYVVLVPSGVSDLEISGFSIESEAITEWIGPTEKQREIFEAFRAQQVHQLTIDQRTEFSQSIGELGTLSAVYDLESSQDLWKGNITESFLPKLYFDFNTQCTFQETIDVFLKLYNFLSFLIGKEFAIQQLKVECGSRGGYLYMSREVIDDEYRHHGSILPLGTNEIMKFTQSPVLPTGCFEKFFKLPPEVSDRWVKYFRYRSRARHEDQFLGYFRLLEAMTQKSKPYFSREVMDAALAAMAKTLGDNDIPSREQKGFLEKVRKFGGNKYTTQKCIGDHLKAMPKSLVAKWPLGLKDLQEIVTLRNDISHANNYYVDEYELARVTVFVEVLLLNAFCKAVGIPEDQFANGIDRLPGYHVLLAR